MPKAHKLGYQLNSPNQNNAILKYQLSRKVKTKDQPLLLLVDIIPRIYGNGKVLLLSYLSTNEKYIIFYHSFSYFCLNQVLNVRHKLKKLQFTVSVFFICKLSPLATLLYKTYSE